MSKRRTRQKLLTRLPLAQSLGVHVRTIANYQADGMPVFRRGRGGQRTLFDAQACVAWVAARDAEAGTLGADDLRNARARKDRATAILAEQLHARRAADLLPAADVERIWSAEIADVRRVLEGLVEPLARRLLLASASEGLLGVERELDASVRDVLTTLADPHRVLPTVNTEQRETA